MWRVFLIIFLNNAITKKGSMCFRGYMEYAELLLAIIALGHCLSDVVVDFELSFGQTGKQPQSACGFEAVPKGFGRGNCCDGSCSARPRAGRESS